MNIIDPSSVDEARKQKKTPKERFQEAESAFKEGRKTEALQMLRDLDREFPNQPNLVYCIAVVRQAVGHAQDAHKLAMRLRDEFKDHPAWGTMIVEGDMRGTRRLAEPKKS